MKIVLYYICMLMIIRTPLPETAMRTMLCVCYQTARHTSECADGFANYLSLDYVQSERAIYLPMDDSQF